MGRAVKVQGIECPMIREGDDIVDIVVDNVLKIVQKTSKEWYDYEGKQLDFPITTYNINDNDIIDLKGGDNKWADNAIKEDIETYHSLKGNYKGQIGTTPRLYRDLLASLMDLTSGSGDRATPVVLVQNYF